MRTPALLIAVLVAVPLVAAQTGESISYLGVKWDHEPLKVYVAMQRGTEGYREDLLTAFEDWSSALKDASGSDAFNFAIVEDRKQADIVVRVRKNTGFILGMAIIRDLRNDGIIDKVQITLAAENALGLPLDGADFRNIARHEIGHALGLGHSTNESDLMYEAYDFTEVGYDIYPSACDVAALLHLYFEDGFGEPNLKDVPPSYQC